MTEKQKQLLKEALSHIDSANDKIIESLSGCDSNLSQAKAKIRKALALDESSLK